VLKKGDNSMNFEIDKQKFKELVLYICSRADRSNLGSIKLRKILWLSDFISYLRTGKPITGVTYIKQEFGPVPNHLPPAIDELESEGRLITRETRPFNVHKKWEYIAMADPDLSLFTGVEIGLVNEIMEYVLEKHTAESISDFSHNTIWELAEIGEEIPYEAAFAIESGEITGKEIEIAKERLSRIP